MNFNLASPFYLSACKYADRLAISADGQELTYAECLEQVVRVAEWLRAGTKLPRRVGILASRSADCCIATLAAAWIGAAYVPINLSMPEQGKLRVMNRANLDALIADSAGSSMLTQGLLDAAPDRVLARTALIPERSSKSISDFEELKPAAGPAEPALVDGAATGYIMFTSGSTGVPKGVVISCGAVDHFLRVMAADYSLTPEDRVAGTFAATFDLSVHNLFATMYAGASLHIVPDGALLSPTKLIQSHEITCWFSVPSLVELMDRMNLLKPGIFPTVRQSLFCGEPLLSKVASAWQASAPASSVTNMYGPTEATVMCLKEDFRQGCATTRDCVAIGLPFPGMKASVLKPEMTWAADGEDGELLLSGPQLADGYLDDPEKTRNSFIIIGDERWYRTGDLAHRDSNGIFHYLGRIDNQVKVLGYRVELEEIEFHLREITGCKSVAAIAWPLNGTSASGIAAFLAGFQGAVPEIKAAMQQRLPFYMVPSQFRQLAELPTNSNGKVDRRALRDLLDRRVSA